MKKLHGDVLLGFSDFIAVGESTPTSGLQVRELLGAARPKTPPKGPGAPPPRKGPKTIKPAPRVPYGKIEQKGAKYPKGEIEDVIPYFMLEPMTADEVKLKLGWKMPKGWKHEP